MERKSKVLLMIFFLALFSALSYSYYRYVLSGDFLIDESQLEIEEEVVEEEAGMLENDSLSDEAVAPPVETNPEAL